MRPTTVLLGSALGALGAQAQETCERTKVAVLLVSLDIYCSIF